MLVWPVSEEERRPSEEVGERQKPDLLGLSGDGRN